MNPVLSVLVTLFISSSGWACSCSPDSAAFNLKKAAKEAERIIVGRVIKVQKIIEGLKPLKVTRFEVERMWKGEKKRPKVFEVRSEMHMCSLHFVEGQSYLLFSFKEPSKNTVCNGTSVLESAGEKIKELDKIFSAFTK